MYQLELLPCAGEQADCTFFSSQKNILRKSERIRIYCEVGSIFTVAVYQFKYPVKTLYAIYRPQRTIRTNSNSEPTYSEDETTVLIVDVY